MKKEWEPKNKTFTAVFKQSIILAFPFPFYHNVKRYLFERKPVADMIYLEDEEIDQKGVIIIDPIDSHTKEALWCQLFTHERFS